jgi:hypothetical protein
MPNHVHVIVVPSDEDRLRRTVAEAQRRYRAHQCARSGLGVANETFSPRTEGYDRNERLCAEGLMAAFDAARADRNLPEVRRILESLYFDELSTARILSDLKAF